MPRLPDTFTYREARALGLSKRRLYELRDAGEIELVSRGLYRHRDAVHVDEDLLELATRSKRATLCLGTALSRQELSDEIAATRDVAIPRGTRPPTTRARVRWHTFDPTTFEVGRELVPVHHGITIGQYSAERSIVDAFRLRGREGHELGYEALRRWLRRPGTQPATLLEMAKQFPRALTPLRQALEALL
jgi:Transcriptional regulator, AbiEi antitoxin